MKNHTSRVWLGVCLPALLAPQIAFAQAEPQSVDSTGTSAENEVELGVGDIVVTARKRKETSNNVGMSISAFTGDTLAQKGITGVDQLVKAVPGFNYTRSAYGSPVFTLRGIGFNETSLAASPTVSVYVDEVPLPYSVMTQGAALDMQRVEVLKGPQGTLFGQNSTGGAVNYIAARPTDQLEAGLDVTVAQYSQVEASGFVSGPISSTLRARIAARKEYGGDWQQSASRPGDTFGKTDRVQARLLLDWDASDRLKLSFNLNGWRDKSDPQAGQFVGLISGRAPAEMRAQRPTVGNARIADWDAGTNFYTNDDFWQIAVRGDYEVADDLTLTSITAYEKMRRDTYVDADGTPVQNFAAANFGSIKTFSQELRIAGKAGSAVNWMIGGNYQHDDTYDVFQPHAVTSSFPFDIASAIGANKVDSYAVFGNVDWELASGLTLNGGLRYSWQDRGYTGCLYDSGAGDLAAVVSATSTRLSGTPTTIAPGACVTLSTKTFKPEVFVSDLNERNLSWKVGLNWQVTPRHLLYATVSKGYKNGVFITTGATFAAQLQPATQESVVAYEAGFKLGLFGRTMQLNGAAFYYDYKDKQIRGRVIDPVLGGLNRLINIPKSRIAGAELQLTWEPVDGLNISAGGTYVGSKILGNFSNFTPLGRQIAMSGDPFPLTPAWQLSGDIQYDTPVSESVNVFVGAGATYQSRTNSALGQEPLFDVKQYTLVDLRAGIHANDDSWRISVFARNLGNAYYWNNVAFNGPDAAIRFAGRPRMIGVSGSYRLR
ncbi:TonB-dependent receptor [Novosphingobium olei]|uniref:TonB-dependent receptor n=1 Tax=Novosphingobium olei TaxID=2728851 RepID=UPI00308553A5|nr:TonB-dependent receptor [Novosphingobium olei]